MLAIGIDVSKSKSAIAILNQDGTVHTKPFEFHHTKPELDALIKYIRNQQESVTTGQVKNAVPDDLHQPVTNVFFSFAHELSLLRKCEQILCL